jgi:branched-chain amino acid transport system permease protein
VNDFIFALLLGIGTGAVYAILSVGLVVAYRGSGVINFAQGAIAMYAARTFTSLRTTTGGQGAGEIFLPWVDIIPEWGWLRFMRLNNLPVRISISDEPIGTAPAMAIALALAALIGLLAHFVVFRPLRNASPLSKVIASVGVMIYLIALANLHFGTKLQSDLGWGGFKRTQDPIENFLGLGSSFPRSSLWLFGAGVVVTFSVWALIRFTRFGLAARAVDENERGMALLGYSADRIAGVTWVLSSVLSALAGIVFVGISQADTLTLLVVPALGAALFGNLTSIPVAALGGVAIAMAQSGGVWLAGRDAWPDWAPPPGVRQFVPLLIVVVLLFFRGDRLPVRGVLNSRGEPRAPVPDNPVKTVAIGAGFVIFILLFAGWKVESGLTTTMVAGIFMLSLVVLVGFLGQISLAQWSIAGLAAFTMIRLSANGSKIREFDLVAKNGPDWPDLLAGATGIVVAVIAGLVIALPAVRVRGLQLAVITIAAVIALEDMLIGNDAIMGAGAAGSNPVPKPEFFGLYVGAQKQIEGDAFGAGTSDNPTYTMLVLFIAVVCALGVSFLRRGSTGRRFLAVRSNERAAAAAGINVARVKLLGFGISSGLAGIAGVLFAYKLPAITAQNFDLFGGLGLLAFVYIAGITTVPGAFVGGVLVSGGLLASLSASDAGSASARYSALVGAAGLLIAARMANGEGVLRLRDRFYRWRDHWNDRPAELAAWGESGRVPVLVLGGIAASDFVARGGLAIALEDLQDQFGFSDFQAGLLPFADVVAGAIIVIGAGYLADKLDRTRLLTALMVIWAMISAATGLIGSFLHLFFMRTALGAMTAVDDPASSSLLSDYYAPKIRHKAFSWRLVAPVVGGAFGNVSVGIAIDNWGWRWGFVVGAIPAAILIGFVARLKEPVRGGFDGEATDVAPLVEGRSWRRDLAAMRKVRSLPWLIGASAFGFGPAIGVTFWAPTFLRRHHDLTAGEAAGLFGFAALSGALLGGWIASRGPEKMAGIRHAKVLIAAGGALGGIILLMLAYSPTPVGMKFPLLMLGAAGLVASGPILAALISEVTPASIRGSVFSVNTFCRLSLSALAPLAIGFVADQVVFVDQDVPIAIVADEAVEDRADRYECEEGKIILEDDDPDPDDRANRNLYECGDEEVGHLGAGMVSVLAVGLVSGIGALRARRYLDDDIIANGGVPDEVIGGDPPELPSEDERAKHPADR